MKIIIFTLMLLLATMVITVGSHETKSMKHSSTGQCFGWENLGNNMKMCYRNEEQTICVYLIWSHNMWHVSKEFSCPK